jgi:uncharacterized protein (TIGR03437 family)
MSAAGLCQLNIRIPQLADGDHPLVATVGGVSTQRNLFLAIRR